MTEARPVPAGHGEFHGGGMATRLNWLRAAVLGANDGIVSTAGLVVGVAGASSSRTSVVTAGLAGLFAGALAMASGEYVSVSSQRDSERAMLALERRELSEAPQAELAELACLYEAKGLAPELAREFAERLSEHDAFAAHADAELSIDPAQLARPGHAAAHGGAGRPAPPQTAGIWAAQVAGPGTQALRWTAQEGSWVAVAMNPDGSAGLTVRADAGVSAPWLARLAAELIAAGIIGGALSAALIAVPARLASEAR